VTDTPQRRFEDAQRRLLAEYGVSAEDRQLRLADPTLTAHVLESGAGDPIVLVHGSGMSAATWTPLIPHLDSRRVVAVDLPGFGLSDPYDYSGRTLRRHAVAQMTSFLDALGLDRAPIVGTSLGAMWALCLAVDAPERVTAVVGLGVPAVALPGTRSNAFFGAMTIPGVGRLVARVPAPSNAKATRRAMGTAIGRRALDRTPDAFFDVVAAGMRMPGWGQAMWTHLNLAFQAGRQRAENVVGDDELRGITAPVLLIWGEGDIYGGPQLAEHALALIPDARMEILAGGHAPFLDDPDRCGALIAGATRGS
jgi:pimeloyl-ACP methyl ester carboxylesterase